MEMFADKNGGLLLQSSDRGSFYEHFFAMDFNIRKQIQTFGTSVDLLPILLPDYVQLETVSGQCFLKIEGKT